MASVKFIAVSRGLKHILKYITDIEKTTDRLITGVNCMAQTAQDEFETVKKQFHKTEGRSYYHIVQAFSPDDPVDFDTAHEIGLKFAEYFSGFQCVVATHMNTHHIHNHIVMNSVSYENGKKFHQSAREMEQAKNYSNQLCLQYGLSITETKADKFEEPLWKQKLKFYIKKAMECTYDIDDFINTMEDWGYKVKWDEGHKYITYTTPENYKCRDSKLFDDTLLRENMELYFAMGGREYLDSRMEYVDFGEPEPTLDDVVCGLASIFEAISIGDNDRFHLETIHHSKREIELMLRSGQKISPEMRAVMNEDDEDEHYTHYHGFGMTMM